MREEKGARRPWPEARPQPAPFTASRVMREDSGASNPLRPTRNRCKAQFGPTLNFPSRSPVRRDALGRRAAEGVPDSRSASERGERANGPKSPREQGRRHLVVKSQVSDKAARRA